MQTLRQHHCWPGRAQMRRPAVAAAAAAGGTAVRHRPLQTSCRMMGPVTPLQRGCMQTMRIATPAYQPVSQHRLRWAAPAATAPGGGDGMSAEEEAAYAELLQKRKAERQQQRAEHKRRRTFDPLSPRRTAAPAISDNPAAAAAATNPPPAAAAAAAARPRLAPGQLASQGSDPRSGAGPDQDISELVSSILADGEIPEAEILDDLEDLVGEESDLSGGSREEAARQAAGEAALRRQRVPVPARRRRLTPAQLKLQAAMLQGDQAPAQPGGGSALSRAGSTARSSPAAAPGGAAAAAAAAARATNQRMMQELMGEDAEDEDELDWDALGQYEEFEAAARRELEQQALQQQRRARQQGRQGAAAAAPASAQAAAPRPATSQQQQQQQQQNNAAGGGALDRDIADLEGLLGFLEAMETDGDSTAPAKARGGGKAASSGGKAGGADTVGGALDEEVDWGQLEKALFGEGWEADLIAELAADLQEGEEGEEGGGGAAAGSGRGEDEAEPWADEVTNLLLGLVMTSHQKYLESPLLEAPVSEDDRAAAVWGAPFVLLVLDDSRQQQLEYSNAAASALFGKGYLDLFGTEGHELVAADDRAQAEWAFALREAEESFGHRATIPSLALAAAGGRRAVARDVAVFRVDSLEGDQVGQAVLIREWEVAG